MSKGAKAKRRDTWVDDTVAIKLEYAAFLKRLDDFNEKTRKLGLGGHCTPRITLRELNAWARFYLASTPKARRQMVRA